MKQSKTIKVLLAFFLLSTYSCSLDDDNSGFFYSLDDFNNAFAGTYSQLIEFTNSYYLLSEFSTDELVVPPGTNHPDFDILNRLNEHTWRPDDELIREFWNFAYTGIQAANLAIFISQQDNFSIGATAVAEVRTLRAFYYYLLLDLVGNVPVVTESTDLSESLTQNTRAELFAFIESEIKAVLSQLPEESNYSLVRKDMARTLLAKLYLNAEIYTGTAQWEKCLEECEAIIDNGEYELVDNFFDVFSPSNGNIADNEIIFPIVYQRGNFLAPMNLPIKSLHPAQLINGSSVTDNFPNWAVTPEVYQLFDHGNDLRADALYLGLQINMDGDTIRDAAGTAIDYQLTFDENNPFLSGPRVSKYQLDSLDLLSADNDFVLFRYADVLMMKAEAHNELGQTSTAIDLINEVRSRSMLAPLSVDNFNQASLRERILTERATEFFMEGCRRQDLIRHGKFCGNWALKLPDDDCNKRILFPIPADALLNSPELVQNPGY